MIGQGRVGIIGNNKISLSIFQKPNTFNGGLIGNFDMNIRVLFMKLIQVGRQVVTADGADSAFAPGP